MAIVSWIPAFGAAYPKSSEQVLYAKCDSWPGYSRRDTCRPRLQRVRRTSFSHWWFLAHRSKSRRRHVALEPRGFDEVGCVLGKIIETVHPQIESSTPLPF